MMKPFKLTVNNMSSLDLNELILKNKHFNELIYIYCLIHTFKNIIIKGYNIRYLYKYTNSHCVNPYIPSVTFHCHWKADIM